MLEDAQKKAAATPTEGGKFNGAGKQKELITLQVNDEFFIPEDAPVCDVPIRGRKNDDGSQATFQAVFAKLYRPVVKKDDKKDEKKGKKKASADATDYVEMAIAISPGVFSRSFEIVDSVTGKNVGKRAVCDGEGAEAFYSGLDLDDQMNKTRGIRWKVDAINEEYSFNPQFGDKKPRTQRIYTTNKA